MRRIFGIQIALGLAFAATAMVPDARALCSSSHPVTQLAAGCAVAWDNSDHQATESTFNPWPAASLDPGDEPEKADTSRMVALNANNCSGAAVRLLNVNAANHLALVRCNAPAAMSSVPSSLWVNLDSLSCEDHNVLAQTDLIGPTPPKHCSVPPGVPSESTVSDFTSLNDHALTDLQQTRLDRIHRMISDLDQRSRDDSYNLLDPYLTLAETSASSTAQRTQAVQQIRTMIRASHEKLRSLVARMTRSRLRGGYGENCDRPRNSEDPDIIHGQSLCSMLKLGLEKAEELDGIASDEDLAQRIDDYKHGIRMNDEYLRLRIALFYGLSDSQERQMISSGKVQLIRRATEVRRPVIYDLHDGYVFGGHRYPGNGKWAYDCSDFTASIIGERAGAPTTYELRNIALALSDPAHAPQLTTAAARYKSCFETVDLRAGQEPQPLDLVVSRNDVVAEGHVVLVDQFDRRTGDIIDFEAHGEPARRVGRFRRPLFEESACQAPLEGGISHGPPPRPDIFILRLKTHNVQGCPLDLDGP